MLDLLARLVDRSLVVRGRAPRRRTARPRYRLLETLRQYAAERLAGAGEAEASRERHAALLPGPGGGVGPRAAGPHRRPGCARLGPEHDNLRAALRWCGERGRAEAGLRLAVALADW